MAEPLNYTHLQFNYVKSLLTLERQCKTGVKLIFTGGHVNLVVAFKGPNVTLGLCTCNYSLTRGKELGAAPR